MAVDEIVDEDKIEGVIRENRCPYCGDCVVEDHGTSDSASVRMRFFDCLNCHKHFEIADALCDRFR